MFDNADICAECGGKCCKHLPGICYPSDFDLPGSFDKLDSAINSGRYCVDWWEGDPQEDKDEYDCGYYIRPAIVGKIGIKRDPAWGGQCNFLTDSGCELSSNDRPYNCRMLKPIDSSGENCTSDASNQTAAIAWLPYYYYLSHI